jgi:hypothetical protein
LDTTRNRIVLTRARWARETCGEILLARYARDPAVRLVDTVDLGRGSWCRAELESGEARLDLNLASREMLQVLIANDSLVDAFLDWRDSDDVERPRGAESAWYRAHGLRTPRNGPLADVGELSLIRGFDPARADRFASLLGVSGSSRLDLGAVTPELLPLIPGLSADAFGVILRRRAEGRMVGSTDELLTLLPPAARDTLVANLQEFESIAEFRPGRLRALVEGGVRGSHLASRATLTVIPTSGRLAVVRREAD